MSNDSLNAEIVFCPPSNKVTTTPENASGNAISYCNRMLDTCCFVATRRENPDKGLERKAIRPHPGNIGLRVEEVPEIGIQILVP
ncbi:hypothetical protein TNCV_2234181 [Trichonephila clavipes]|nr:hypothetical protein TNCV_2234181 [Trichonephila clavipes]